MLTVCTWRWGNRYGQEYVERLRAGVARNMHQPYRFKVFEPDAEDRHLTEIPGCFARLRMFDPEWQRKHGIERAVCLDLDLVVTGSLDRVFDRAEPFVILQGVNSANPNPYNGSVWMLDAGYRPDVWTSFSIEAARGAPFYAFPDDQAWKHHKIPGAASFGPKEGVYAFGKPGWPGREALPGNAAIVAFPGRRDPSRFTHLDWVRKHWR